MKTPQGWESVMVVGKSGSGKSTYLDALILGSARPVVLVDPKREHLSPTSRHGARHYVADAAALADPGAVSRGEPPCVELADRAALHAWNLQDCTFICDEFDLCSNNRRSPVGVLRLLMHGRGRGISVVLAARRPSEISPQFTSQTTSQIAFRTTEPRDVDYLTRRGVPAEMVQGLDVGHFVHVTDNQAPHVHHGLAEPCQGV